MTGKTTGRRGRNEGGPRFSRPKTADPSTERDLSPAKDHARLGMTLPRGLRLSQPQSAAPPKVKLADSRFGLLQIPPSGCFRLATLSLTTQLV